MRRPVFLGWAFTMLFVFCGLSVFPVVAIGGPVLRLIVEAGAYERVDTPVSLSLEGVPIGFPDERLELVRVDGGRREIVASQLEAGSPPRLWWILSGKMEPGARRVYELSVVEGKATGRSGSDGGGISVRKQQKYCEILWEGRKVLRYNHGVVPAPEGQSRLYDRSGFIHPLWAPTGTVLTNIHPEDHIHHVGIWMPWTKTKFKGREVDFWNLGKGEGTVRFVRYLSVTDGPIFGGFEVEQEHVALAGGEEVVLKENWDVRVYHVGGVKDGYWLWDFVSKQRCVADSPLKLLQYRYGGFGFRGAAEWEGDNAAYLTSEGRTRKDGHGTRARWCDVAGRIGGRWQGVTVMSHPKNFRHPEPMRIWPSGQVFFNFAPEQLGDFEMRPGEDHVFRYRLFVHEGPVDVKQAERLWRDFADPPRIIVERLGRPGAIVLFDGSDFARWTTGENRPVGWRLVDDAMRIVPKSGSIMTKQRFRDFKLHVEFKTPQLGPGVKGQGRGNSGVYLQRRYEVQILDSYGEPPRFNECASLYRFRAPDRNVCRPAGRWQSYDILFRAARFAVKAGSAKKIANARISVWHNGILVHDDVELANKTGAGQKEGPEPGPILLQDHGNEVWFRNIWIVPLEK